MKGDSSVPEEVEVMETTPSLYGDEPPRKVAQRRRSEASPLAGDHSNNQQKRLCLWLPTPPSEPHSRLQTVPSISRSTSRKHSRSDDSIHSQLSDDDSELAPYMDDIYLWKKELEEKYHPVECLRKQPQITSEMRSALMEWLLKVSQQLKFNTETFFSTVNVTDRFLSTTAISRDCLQLLGVTAMFVCAKNEEVFPPDIVELIELCAGNYETQHFKQMEILLLSKICFDLNVPTSYYFLHHFWHQVKPHVDPLLRVTVSCMESLLTRTTFNYTLSQFPPSLLAAAVIYIFTPKFRQLINSQILQCGYVQDDIQKCCEQIHTLLEPE